HQDFLAAWSKAVQERAAARPRADDDDVVVFGHTRVGRGRQRHLTALEERCSHSVRRMYLFTVAQIFNLPYRRFVIGRTLLAAGRWQVKNLRYSRLQLWATGAPSTLTHTWTGTASAKGSARGEPARPQRQLCNGRQSSAVLG